MTTTTKKKGRRLGPLQLGKRCKHAAAEVGHIHEARNVETGEPALVMLLAALDAVEGNARMRAHLTREPMGWWPRPLSLKGLAAVGLAMLVLGGGFWLSGTGSRELAPSTPPPSTSGLGELADAGLRSPFLVNNEQRGSTGIAYPLPDKPFVKQLTPPCRTRSDEVAINGGCWMELARRPPCHEDHAEYQGKCYAPVAKRTRPPQSLSP